jgi:hypothetical protein
MRHLSATHSKYRNLGIPLTQVAQHIVSRRSAVGAAIGADFLAGMVGGTVALARPAKVPVATEWITINQSDGLESPRPACPNHQNHHI